MPHENHKLHLTCPSPLPPGEVSWTGLAVCVWAGWGVIMWNSVAGTRERHCIGKCTREGGGHGGRSWGGFEERVENGSVCCTWGRRRQQNKEAVECTLVLREGPRSRFELMSL